ncbi:hypothetical protein KDD17_14265 [Sulfitobacter albidus]|uniref:Ferrochelatase n=1 Tax=Sulfitobacter albidus TaxID=2829501 RepID=A0A975JD58_9RHOB|nr:hypothetical protein [Sulfitobacter albidus]QUJ76075.1 hypothetical protein KDD17_14265 [Sulfitobacter albidus]
MLKTLSVSALIAMMASASFAGSLGTATVEAEPQDEGVFVPQVGSGIGVPAVIGAVAAAAVLAAVVSNDSDSDTTTGAVEED